MTPKDNGTRFPKTNKEYFRLVLVNGLILSVVAFLFIIVAGKLLFPRGRLLMDDFAKLGAVSLLIGFNLTLLRLRWLKGRDK
jgi:hypothetical protein